MVDQGKAGDKRIGLYLVVPPLGQVKNRIVVELFNHLLRIRVCQQHDVSGMGWKAAPIIFRGIFGDGAEG